MKFLEEMAQFMFWFVIWGILFYATIWFGVIIMLYHCCQAVSGRMDVLYTGIPTIFEFGVAIVTTLWWMERGKRFQLK